MRDSNKAAQWLGSWSEEGIGWVAKRASNRKIFLASALGEFADQRGLSPERLADFLGCNPDRLAKLALCRRPNPNSADFISDIENIASHNQIDPFQLRQLLEVVNSTATEETWSQLASQPPPWGLPEHEPVGPLAAREPRPSATALVQQMVTEWQLFAEMFNQMKAQAERAGAITPSQARTLREELKKLTQKLERIRSEIESLIASR
jgi:hypothetical protein